MVTFEKKIILVLFIFCFGLINSYDATCEDKELIKKAEQINIKFVGELRDIEQLDEPDYEWQPPVKEIHVGLSIDNIPENVYFIVINNTLNKKNIYREFDNGVLYIDLEDIYSIQNFTIKVYSSNPVCENELLRTVTLNSLKYNFVAISETCQRIREEIKENNIKFSKCDLFVDEDLSVTDQWKIEEEYEQKKLEQEQSKVTFKSLFCKYFYFGLIPAVVLGGYYTIRIVIINRRKKRNEQ